MEFVFTFELRLKLRFIEFIGYSIKADPKSNIASLKRIFQIGLSSLDSQKD